MTENQEINSTELQEAFKAKVLDNAKKRHHMIARYQQDVNPAMYINLKLDVLMDCILTTDQKLQVSMATENLMADALDETLKQLARAELLQGVAPS